MGRRHHPGSAPPRSPRAAVEAALLAALLLSAGCCCRTLDLPADWDRRSPYGFEVWALETLPGDDLVALGEADLEELTRSLDGWDERALRAAIILARCRDPRGTEIFLARLERRLQGPERESDAADVVIAASLVSIGRRRNVVPRLVDLVVGPDPHPDLEVRVECAATALIRESDAPIPFLLRVLREATSAAEGPPDWTPKPTMAWAKSRASHALAVRAGIPNPFRPDASVSDQAGQAEQIEAALDR